MIFSLTILVNFWENFWEIRNVRCFMSEANLDFLDDFSILVRKIIDSKWQIIATPPRKTRFLINILWFLARKSLLFLNWYSFLNIRLYRDLSGKQHFAYLTLWSTRFELQYKSNLVLIWPMFVPKPLNRSIICAMSL